MGGDKLFGFWIDIRDEGKARYAVRMAGLPLLVLGANAAVLGLDLAVKAPEMPMAVPVFAVIAVVLVLVAFRMRAGRAAWVPLALLAILSFLAVELFSSLHLLRMLEPSQSFDMILLAKWVVPLFCLALAFSGFRGWLWLRRNGLPQGW